MIAKGEVPRWDTTTGKYVSNSTEEIEMSKPSAPVSSPTKSTTVSDYDPQEDSEEDDDLPF